ncbi:OmpH family outer membrane protein [Sphingomonas sp. BN140010]|uniref:OmpH family outer membrane protein n=1 Tax=Sphingomonas arvum TaxID=2992113 RepID=A0ABT3JEN5_9SPHN|nr:OmpH family outer membrane protein [Sphingomonas sp. BN140010]MCW3797474.1 OmpH family outer membrane protein [Sphingomonas sp. BN140010]
MKTKLLLAAVAASAFVPAAAQAQRIPAAVVAVVDTDRIGRECTACRAAASQLQSQETTLRNRAAALQQQLQTARTPIEQAAAALNGKQPDAALQKRITDYQNQERSAQQELATGQQRLASTQANVNQQIGSRLNTIVASLSASRGATVTLAKGDVMFAAQTVDITNDVLAQLNQQLPSVSVTPLPQTQQPRQQGR